MGQERNLLCCIKQRQLKFLGHVIRKGELEDLALSGRIPRKRARASSVSHSLTTLNICAKILDNYRLLPETEKLKKHHSTSRAGTALIPKEKKRASFKRASEIEKHA